VSYFLYLLVVWGYGNVSSRSLYFIQSRTSSSYLAFLSANLSYPGIWVCLPIWKSTSILVNQLIPIILKEAAPSPSFLGKINGLAASVGGAASRTIAFVASIGVILVFFIGRRNKRPAGVRFYMAPIGQERLRDDMVHIRVVGPEGAGGEAGV